MILVPFGLDGRHEACFHEGRLRMDPLYTRLEVVLGEVRGLIIRVVSDVNLVLLRAFECRPLHQLRVSVRELGGLVLILAHTEL